MLLALALTALAGLPLPASGPKSGPTLGPGPRLEEPPSQARPTPPGNAGPRLRALLRRSPGPYRVLAIDVDPRALPKRGVQTLAELGPVSVLRVEAPVLAAVARAARSLELPAPHRPLLDLSRVAIGAEATDHGSSFAAPHRGQGVLIGAYDSGIDLSHPDFRTLDGRLRVLGTLDQDREQSCDPAELSAGQCAFSDATGHGTHVLSIAAGASPRFRGIAPEADLLVARSTLYDGFVEALSWLRDRARAAGRPLVINVSLGGHLGAHDGTSPECMAIDALDALVVVAAGNEGQDAVHAATTLIPGAAVDLALDLPPDADEQHAIIDLWGAPTSSITAELIAVEGGVVVYASGPVGLGSAGATRTITIRGAELGTVDLDAEAAPNPRNSRPHLTLELALPGWAAEHDLALRLRGSGEVHAWVDTLATVRAPPSFAALPRLGTAKEILGDSALTLSDLAAAKSAIAVSSWITRTRIDELSVSFDEPLFGISAFSSFGPSLDPARTGPKPDLAAPGAHVVAAARRSPPVGGLHVGTLYRALSGTSMAVPHVTGAAAVLLEIAPQLDKERLRGLLLDHARPQGTDPRFGRGALDLEASAHAALGDAGCGCSHAGGRRDLPLLLLLAAALWGYALRRGGPT